MTNEQTNKQIKEYFKSAFETKTRDNKEEFQCVRDDITPPFISLQEIKNIMFENDFHVEDFNYSFLSEAFDFLSTGIEEEYTAADNEEDLRDQFQQQNEGDIYNKSLLSWFASNMDRVGRVEEVIKELGLNKECELIPMIQIAQAQEKEEIFNIALSIYLAMFEASEEEEVTQ